MNLNFLTEPVPHAEAVRLIADKPAVARDIFDQLPIELRGRAFTITGIEDFDVQQAVRDEIAKLPTGADWNKVKKEIARKISPWLDEDAAERRAKLLLNHHGRAAYAATHTRVLDAQMDVFPFRMYRSSMRSKKPRDSHQALNGLVLPADHRFWETHTPPWEFGCNCLDPLPMTAEDADEERAADAARPPEERRVLDGTYLDELESGTLTRGQGARVDIRTPRERTGGTGYQWSPRQTVLPYEQIRTRWDEDVAAAFEEWAQGIPMAEGTTLLDHLTGQAPGGGRQQRVARAATFAEALANSGLAEKAAWERKDLANLRAAMRVENPLPAGLAIASIEGAKAVGALTTTEIRRTVQDVLDITPRALAATLPELRIRIVERLTEDGKATNEAARYRRGGRLQISAAALKGLKGEARRKEVRRILSHELAHWVHLDAQGPAADAYRAAIRSHYAARTATDALETDPRGFRFRRDGWWHRYAGTEYGHENGSPAGLEIPSVYFELWETPEWLTLHSDLEKPSAAAFRETFALVNSIFDSTP